MAGRAMNPIERAEAELAGLGYGEKAPEGGKSQEETPQLGDAGQTPDQNDDEVKKQEAKKEPEAPAKTEDEDPNSETYKARWLSLNGIIKSEREKSDALREQVKLLMDRVSAISTGSETPSGDNMLPTDPTITDMKEHLATMSEEYGDVFAAALEKYVAGYMKQHVGDEFGKIEGQINDIRKSSEETRRDTFRKDLTKRCSDWEEVIGSPEFGGWLETNTDDLSGSTYSALFDNANKQWNMDRMVTFFNLFKNETGIGQAPSDGKAKDEKVESADPREDMVSPTRGSSASTPSSSKGQDAQWTIAKVNQFYKDLRTGKFNGKEDEANRIEASIIKANAEGRVA